MRGSEQVSVQLNEQVGGAIGTIDLGMPLARGGNNPFMQTRAENRRDSEVNWQKEGMCAQTDPEAFFPERGQSNRVAKAICRECVVRPICLEDVLASADDTYGVRGGLSQRERIALRKQRAASKEQQAS